MFQITSNSSYLKYFLIFENTLQFINERTMKNWMNKVSGFESISKIESFALNHFIYSTPFNQLFNRKINVKRKRIVMMILGLNWVLIFLILSTS